MNQPNKPANVQAIEELADNIRRDAEHMRKLIKQVLLVSEDQDNDRLLTRALNMTGGLLHYSEKIAKVMNEINEIIEGSDLPF